MTHAQLIQQAVIWLRAYRCGVVLSEQCCANGEMPDAIGWKRACHSVLIECKISRSDFLADRDKPFRQKSERGLGCERFYLTPPRLLRAAELAVCRGYFTSISTAVSRLRDALAHACAAEPPAEPPRFVILGSRVLRRGYKIRRYTRRVAL